MPAPTNISAATAVELGPLPNSITQDVNFGGTTYTVWYKYTAQTTDNEVGFFPRSDDLALYKPIVASFSPDGVTPYLGGGGINKPFQIPVTSSQVYYFEISSSTGNVATAHLTISGQQFADQIAPLGSIAVNDDTNGFPLVLISSTTGGVLRFLNPFPSGEQADILPSGILCVEDANAILNQSVVKIYDSTLNLLHTVVVVNTSNQFVLIRSNNVDTFYIGIGADDQHSPINDFGSIQRISTAGVVEQVWVLDNFDMTAGVGVSLDETIAYYLGFSGGATHLKRWDLVNDLPLSDLVSIAASVGKDMLVLLDGTIVVLAAAGTVNTIYLYDPTGALLHTFALGDVRDGKLAQAIDNPNSFWAWKKPLVAGVPTGESIFLNIKASDVSVLATRTGYIYENGIYGGVATLTPPADFGESFSCPFWIMRAAIPLGPPTPPTPPATRVYPLRRQRTFTIPNAENFWIFIKRLEFELQRGMGLNDGQGSDPTLMFQLSRDGGKTWGPERWMSAGKQGEYTHRSIVRRLGRARNPVGRITTSDPTFWALCDAYLQAGPGTS